MARCSRSMLVCRATSTGREKRSTPRPGRPPWRIGAWCGGATSTAMGQGDLAGHGGEHPAVLVYQIASCRYWQDRSGEATSPLGNSAKTSPSGASPTTRCALAIATAIGAGLFEVTQPRVTCYRVGIRMNEPRMAALLVLCRWSDRRRLEANVSATCVSTRAGSSRHVALQHIRRLPPSFS
jgi:hypothetical protein